MLRPTIFTSVPRLWNRIHDRVMATVRAGNPLARRLFAAAYASKKAALLAGDASGGRFGALWDRLVFSKIKARVGGAPSVPNQALCSGLRHLFSVKAPSSTGAPDKLFLFCMLQLVLSAYAKFAASLLLRQARCA